MFRWIVKIVLLSLCFSTNRTVFAEQIPEFLRSQQEFQDFKDQTESDFTAYKKKLRDAFAEYKRQTALIWGEKDAGIPDSKTWISYRDALYERSIVDFEQGTILVQIAVKREDANQHELIRKRMQQAVLNTLIQQVDRRSIIALAAQPIAPDGLGPPALKDQVAKEDGAPLNMNEAVEFAAAASYTVDKKIITGKDGQHRVIISKRLKLVSDHILKRALKYRDTVDRHSSLRKVARELVFAIMETESVFNPTARSNAPAFGLMQLVPSSGARDAYRYIYKQDRVVSDTYLYVPANNIELGVAYINRLYYRYLSGIRDPESRQWATIAAYNTGTGNVLRAFVGKYDKGKFGTRKLWKQTAFKHINGMTSEQVFTHLHDYLPYRETRLYMQKVRDRMPKYTAI